MQKSLPQDHISTRGGMGMKIKFGSGIGYQIPHHITGDVIHRHKSLLVKSLRMSLRIIVKHNIKFYVATEFFIIFSIYDIFNQSILSVGLVSTTADLILYPSGPGIKEVLRSKYPYSRVESR